MKLLFSVLLSVSALWAVVFGAIRGVVHDPDHRPIVGAQVLGEVRQLRLFANSLDRTGWKF